MFDICTRTHMHRKTDRQTYTIFMNIRISQNINHLIVCRYVWRNLAQHRAAEYHQNNVSINFAKCRSHTHTHTYTRLIVLIIESATFRPFTRASFAMKRVAGVSHSQAKISFGATRSAALLRLPEDQSRSFKLQMKVVPPSISSKIIRSVETLYVLYLQS